MKKAAVILIILLIIICAGGGGYYHWQAIRDKEDIRKEALLYFQEEDYQKAADLFEDARARKTLFSADLDQDIKGYLAESYFQLGNYDKAERLYNGMIRENSGNKDNYLLKGRCLQADDRQEEAISCYEAGYDKTGEAILLRKICDVYISEKDYENALSCAEKGMDGDSRQDFLFMKIIICEKSLDYPAAYEAAADYVKSYPDDEKGKKEYIFLSTRIDGSGEE